MCDCGQSAGEWVPHEQPAKFGVVFGLAWAASLTGKAFIIALFSRPNFLQDLWPDTLALRDFRSLADANQQLRAWVLETAGNRCHGTTRQRPLTQFTEAEQGLLQPLPAVPPVPACWAKVKVHRDAHVQFDSCHDLES